VDVIERVLGGIAGGRVLDVATQEGHFVQILMENLKDYTEIVGIDINERAIETAQSTIGQEGVRFLVMNIERIIQRAEGVSNYRELKERGEELRQRLYRVGAQREPILVVIGEK
jgi:2-polyprenyl-3-methyl-5-hydroxy-6-metoxy-1,4-benzoquinol methylase